jgi:hypothetical protein
MKGKKTFTNFEVEKIKQLITEKLQASTTKQKGIRNKIRDIGFYYTDFTSPPSGYTVEGFEELIKSKDIKVFGGDKTPVSEPKISATEQPQNIEKSRTSISESSDLISVLKALKKNRFDPQTDRETKVENGPGIYLICLRNNSTLPPVSIKPILTSFEELEVIYTGIAGGSLRTRDYRQHFKGNNAGRSTLRKSLGVLFGYKQIPRDKDGSLKKTKFNDENEKILSTWMGGNLIMYSLLTQDYEDIEKELINHFNPPLNLKDNHNIINLEFRQLLSQLRRNKNN